MVRREILAVLKANKKGAKSPKPKMPRPPKLVCMHFMSTSTCMNFFIVHGPKGNFGRFEGKQKRGKISETKDATPTKIGLYAFHVNLYLHEFFEEILIFDPHGL